MALCVRVRRSINLVFFGWAGWAIPWGVLVFQEREPFFLIPRPLNDGLFFSLGAITGGISFGLWIHKLKKNRVRLQDARTLEDLLEMSPEAFETLISKLFMAYGHQAEVQGGNGDHGVDVVVRTDEGEKWVVQCKRYSGSVGEPVVRDLYGTMLHEEAQRAYLITTGSFTRQAGEWVQEKPIILYDGEGLVKLIRRTQNARDRKDI
jgi:restriction system protein